MSNPLQSPWYRVKNMKEQDPSYVQVHDWFSFLPSCVTSTSLTCLLYFLDEQVFREREGGGSHLNTEGNNISKSWKWLGRVQPTQGWVNHFSQCVDVMELWGGPSYKALFGSWFWTKKKIETTVFQMWGLHKSDLWMKDWIKHVIYLSKGIRPVNNSNITTPKL
jgi:hypothetical protein